MQNYKNFSECTRAALAYSCAYHQVALSRAQTEELLALYGSLPAFEDAADGLSRLRQAGYRLFAFSNGAAETVEGLLTNAGIRDFFQGIVSTDALRSFKPNPAVYCHFLREAKAVGGAAWMISGNPFDVIGALSAGMKAVWVRRSPKVIFDPWEFEPQLTVSNLRDLADELPKYPTR